MKVLWVIPEIDPRAGGPSSTAVNAVIAESRKGLDVTLACTRFSGEDTLIEPALARMEAAGVRVLTFPRRLGWSKAATWGLSLSLSVWLARRIRSFDLVHLQYSWAATTVLGTMAGRLSGRPVVLTPHESLTEFDVEVTSGHRLKRVAKRSLKAALLRGVDSIAFSSELERRDSGSPAGLSEVIPHAVIEVPLSSPPPEPAGEALVFGFLGRIHPKKNLDLIIEALAGADAGLFRLVIAGSGDPVLEDELGARARDLGISDSITWLGHVSSAERGTFFEGIHVLLMPSEYECFGMVAAEAMGAGIPAIVSRSTGIAELVETVDEGLVLRSTDAAGLHFAVEEFARGGDRGSLRRRCLAAVDRELTFRAYADRTAALYSRLTGRA